MTDPRFDGRAERRARPVVPFGREGEEVTRVAAPPGRRAPSPRRGEASRLWPVALIVVGLLAAFAVGGAVFYRRGVADEARPDRPAASSETTAPTEAPPAQPEPFARSARPRSSSPREGRGKDKNGEGEGRGRGDNEDKDEGEKEREKERDKGCEKERERRREQLREAKRGLRRIREIFKDN